MAKTLEGASLADDERSRRNWRSSPARRRSCIDIARAIALERSDGSGSDLLYWSQASLSAIDAHRADLASSAEAVASRQARLIVLEDAFRAMAMAMEFGFLFDQQRQLLSIGYVVSGVGAGSQLLRPPGLRGAAGQLLRDRQGRRASPALVPARPSHDAGRARRGSDLLVRLDVRISDAAARHARACRKFARSDRSARGASSNRLRREARVAMGRFRIRVQRARSRIDLSIFQLRRARPRAEAGLGSKSRHRALCDRTGHDGRSRRRGRESEAAGGDGREGRLRLLRSGGLHACARSGRRGLRVGARLYGASPRHDDRRHRQRGVRRRDARPFSRRADHSGDGIVVAGAGPARGPDHAALGGRSPFRRASQRRGSPRAVAKSCPSHLSPPADPAALQWPLRRDADGGRLRLQPLGRYGDHPLARGRHLRRFRLLYLSPRHAQRRRLVCGLSTDGRRTRRIFRSISTRSARRSRGATEP